MVPVAKVYGAPNNTLGKTLRQDSSLLRAIVATPRCLQIEIVNISRNANIELTRNLSMSSEANLQSNIGLVLRMI